MKTFTSGRQAEASVAEHLKNNGYKIVELNWRRPRCEIDIIANKDRVVYFVEVKYRVQPTQGEGFDYVTRRKLRQMELAARIWVSENDYEGDWRLMAASVSGANFENRELVEV